MDEIEKIEEIEELEVETCHPPMTRRVVSLVATLHEPRSTSCGRSGPATQDCPTSISVVLMEEILIIIIIMRR